MKRTLIIATLVLACALSTNSHAQEISRSDSLSAAISSVKGEEIWDLSASDPIKALAGKMAGVLVLNTSGEPGAASGLKVRGFSAMMNTISPLIIVDGLRVHDVQYLAPEMIESIEVIKDAVAVGLYGVEAREGALIIQTRKGHAGKGHVFYRNEFAVASIAHKPKMMNANDYLDYVDALGSESFKNLILAQYKGEDTDWISEVFKPSWNMRHTVGVQGGNDRGGYFASFSSYSNDGIFVGKYDRFSRISGQINGSYRVTPWLVLATNNSLETHNGGTIMSTYDIGSPIMSALISPPTSPVFVDKNGLDDYQKEALALGYNVIMDPETGLYLANRPVYPLHPLAMRNYPERTYKNSSFRGSASAVFTPLKGFDITSRFGYAFDKGYSMTMTRPYFYGDRNHPVENETTAEYDDTHLQGELIASYDRTFGKHGIDINGGAMYIGYGKDNGHKLSYFGHLGYTFDGRYSLSGSVNATSYGKKSFYKKTPIAYSVAASARIIDELSLRATWGQSKYFPYPKEMSIFNEGLFSVGNTSSLNVGAVTHLLGGKLTGSLDFFRNTDTTTGIEALADSDYECGTVINTGIEFSMSMSDTIGDFHYSVSADISYLRNRLKALEKGLAGIRHETESYLTETPYWYISVGEPIWYIKGLKAQGIDPQTGEVSYYESGEYPGSQNIIDDGVNIGSGIPDFTFGLNINLGYKGFDLSIVGSGVAGNQIYSSLWSSYRYGQNNYKRVWDGIWKQPGDNAKFPSLRAATNKDATQSSLYVWKGSYFKIRQIQLGYTLPERLMKKVWVKQLRFYASLDNFLCLTNYPGIDPETTITSDHTIGFDGGAYPNPKQIAFGLNLTF
ncbi:MAG: TonB-dependent receptor plug domain-containing protein [Bacteroidales bacterium]|nr:TonB-dependent receptor plug domain-containing protein [Candidatus Cryptobacteroides caccocaballi]